MNPAPRILVTGASGYIGRHTVSLLAALGYDVIALARRLPADHAGQPGMWLERADGLPLAADLQACAAVIHLAGRAHTHTVVEDGVDLFDDANRRLAVDCALRARETGVPAFVLVSTLGVYGNWSAKPITETSPLHGETPYARSKIAGDKSVEEALKNSATRLCIVRPPMVYGPACPGNFTRLVKLIRLGLPLPLRSVTGVRSFIHVDNLADFLRHCAMTPAARGTYVIADGSDFSLPALIRQIGTGLGKRTSLLSWPPMSLRLMARLIGKKREVDSLTRPMPVDWQHAQSTGWSPPISSEQALASTLAEYARH